MSILYVYGFIINYYVRLPLYTYERRKENGKRMESSNDVDRILLGKDR